MCNIVCVCVSCRYVYYSSASVLNFGKYMPFNQMYILDIQIAVLSNQVFGPMDDILYNVHRQNENSFSIHTHTPSSIALAAANRLVVCMSLQYCRIF